MVGIRAVAAQLGYLLELHLDRYAPEVVMDATREFALNGR
jgi:hypothetical protein